MARIDSTTAPVLHPFLSTGLPAEDLGPCLEQAFFQRDLDIAFGAADEFDFDFDSYDEMARQIDRLHRDVAERDAAMAELIDSDRERLARYAAEDAARVA